MTRKPILAWLLWVGFAGSVMAQQSPRILLTNQGMLNECDPLLPCDELSAEFPVGSFWLAMSVNGVTEVSAVHFGVERPAQPFSFVHCSGTFVFTSTMEPVLGVEWYPDEPCAESSGLSVRLGSINLSVPTSMALRVVDHPTLGDAAVVECAGRSWPVAPEHRGIAGVGDVEGYLPCTDFVPVTERSWAEVKWIYRQ